MKTNASLFWILGAFFVVADGIYTVWSLIDVGEVEWVGTVGIALTGILSFFIAFYLGRAHSALGGELPEDLLDANIEDGDAEQGFFSPWSWWPVTLAGSLAIMFLGLAVGPWLSLYAVPLVLIALTGWVYEYYRGLHAR